MEKKYSYEITLDTNGQVIGVADVTNKTRYRCVRKVHRLPLWQRALLLMVRGLYKLVRKVRKADRDTKQGLLALALSLPLTALCFHFGVVEHPETETLVRLATSACQAVLGSCMLVFGFRTLKDVMVDVQSVMRTGDVADLHESHDEYYDYEERPAYRGR